MIARVLAIGGVDPCGGAGLAMDARMVEARGGFAATVPTCLTVQNRHGLTRIEPVAEPLWREMLAAAAGDGPVRAVKLGLLGDASTVRAVAAALREHGLQEVPWVVDPVLSTTAGGFEPGDDLIAAFLEGVVPYTAVLTPNRPELERLSPSGPQALLDAGCGSVLVKGGHDDGRAVEDSLWSSGRSEIVFHHPRLDVGKVHGTGCALAAALACGLARGLDREEACRQAVAAVAHGLKEAEPAADGLPVPLRLR